MQVDNRSMIAILARLTTIRRIDIVFIRNMARRKL